VSTTDTATSASTPADVASTDAPTVQVFRVYIKAPAQRVWDAIVDPAWNGRYGYGAPSTFDLRPGGPFRSTPGDAMRAGAEQMGYALPDVVVDGEVVESDPPRRLVQTWRMVMNEDTAKEPFTRLTYEIVDAEGGLSCLTLTHELTGAPQTADMVRGSAEAKMGSGGWSWVLSDLKTLLETGSSFTAGS